MATKTLKSTEPHDDFKAMPSDMPTDQLQPEPVVPVVPVPDPGPAVVKAPQSDEERRTRLTQDSVNDLVKYLKTLRDSVHDAEAQRMYSVAITHVETAGLWAVRAITYRG